MPKPTYRLECKPCNRDMPCDGKVIAIQTEPHLVNKFRHQELIFAKCPNCWKQYMAWVGVDFVGDDVHQEPISDKKRHYWAQRYIDHGIDLAKDTKVHHMVKGGYRDKQSGHWLQDKLVAVR